MLDTNVIIAAMKKSSGETAKLIASLLRNEDVVLIVNEVLLKEYTKYMLLLSMQFPREKEDIMKLINILIKKAIIVEPEAVHLSKVLPYFDKKEYNDAYHAATCLKTKCIIISNDKDFELIKKEGVVTVWSISEAVRFFLEKCSC